MKLYCDPLSTTSRPVMLFAAEEGLDIELAHVDLLTNGHQDPAYLAINPNGLVPFLVDGDLSIGESSAILRYLAEKVGSEAYPSDLKARTRVNAALDWFNTQLHTTYCLFACYPNMGVPHGLDAVTSQKLLAYGAEHSGRWLKILDEEMLGERPFVCGETISLADYLGASFVTLGEIADFDLSPYPNIQGWLGRMRALPHWDATYATFRRLAAAVRPSAKAA